MMYSLENNLTLSKDFINKNKICILQFTADWCGPCKLLSPLIEELANDYSGRAVVGKLNVDENGETARFYNVMSIPTLLFFKNGQLVDKQVGVVSKDVLRNKINSLL